MNWTHFFDHAALIFSLERKCIETTKSKQPEQIVYETKITFDEQKTEEFKEHLAKNLHELNSENEPTPNVNTQIGQLTTFLAKHSTEIFGRKVPINPNTSKKKTNMPKWFDEECYRKKQDFKKARNKFVKNKIDENRTAFTKSRTI